MPKSHYQKYLIYKKKYLTIKNRLRRGGGGGEECIEDPQSRSFMEQVNKTYRPEIKPVPELSHDKPLPSIFRFS